MSTVEEAAVETRTYYVGDDLPDWPIAWRDSLGDLVKFGTDPHTFVLVLVARATPAVVALNKTGGFVVADSAPNLVVQWSTVGDLNTVSAGWFEGAIRATRASDGKRRTLPFRMHMKQPIGP